jgi:hypothetical protein
MSDKDKRDPRYLQLVPPPRTVFDAGKDYDAKYLPTPGHVARRLVVVACDGYFEVSWECCLSDPWLVRAIDRDRGRAEDLLLRTLEARVRK